MTIFHLIYFTMKRINFAKFALFSRRTTITRTTSTLIQFFINCTFMEHFKTWHTNLKLIYWPERDAQFVYYDTDSFVTYWKLFFTNILGRKKFHHTFKIEQMIKCWLFHGSFMLIAFRSIFYECLTKKYRQTKRYEETSKKHRARLSIQLSPQYGRVHTSIYICCECTLIPFYDFRPFSGLSDVSCDVINRAQLHGCASTLTPASADVLMPKLYT